MLQKQNAQSMKSLALHKRLKGKIEIRPKRVARDMKDLALLYTPGVGAVSAHIGKHPKDSRLYTMKDNTVAVISDGSAVLGLGNIGSAGALPVLEGKCLIFKQFAGVDAFPIALATQDTQEIIRTIQIMSPVFGGINLEDISAPRCFEIERELKRTLDIPVMHDDQHGTAIVVYAALINAARVVEKKFENLSVVVSGAGPAGTAIAYILKKAGIKNMLVLDSKGILSGSRRNLEPYKQALARATNPRNCNGGLEAAIQGADVFIGVSRTGVMRKEHVTCMAPRPIIFALANPTPEIMPDDAHRAGAWVVATGRSDFPNQINNALVFPGVFRGALDHNVRAITDEMKLKASRALARLIARPTRTRIIPPLFDKRVVPAIAAAIR